MHLDSSADLHMGTRVWLTTPVANLCYGELEADKAAGSGEIVCSGGGTESVIPGSWRWP